MRTALALLVLLALAVAAYFAFGSGQDTLAPPSDDPTATSEQQRPDLTSAEAERDRFRTAPPDVNELDNNEPVATAPVGNALEQAIANWPIELTVRNAVDNAPIAAFRWSFRRAVGIARGESNSSIAQLELPRVTVGDLLIEADGMQPFTKPQLVVPAVGEPSTHLDIYLTPVTIAAGITLLVKTLDLQPIANVRVDAFQITDSNREIAWQLGQPLWARRTSQPDGRYELPPLPAGEYGIVLVATDTDGLVLPLAPYRRTFVLTGSNGYLEDVPLEPACALQLELFEGSGQAFDPAVHGNVTISLNPTGQTGLQRKWTAWQKTDGGGKATATISEANRVPGTGIIWVDEPVPPGSYLLEIVVNGDPRVSQMVQLRNNERQLEQVFVR